MIKKSVIPMVFFLLFLGAVFPAPSMAADLFVKPKAPAAPVDAPEPETTTTAPLETPKNAPAKQATIQDFANKYYKSCLGQNHPILKEKNLQLLCACTAAKLPKVMTVPQVKVMSTDTPEGLYQRNRMLMFVYAPCIEYPTRALVVGQCMSDPKVQSTFKHGPTVCSCLGDGMAKFMREKAPDAIQGAMEQNDKNLDPLGALMQSQAFDDQSKSVMHSCISLYELGQSKK